MSKSVQQIVLRLQRDAEKEQSIFWYRRAIVELVDNFLLDLDNAARNLESLGSSSECFSSVQLCEFFVGSSADIFMQVLVQGADTPPLTQFKSKEPTSEENISIAFCTWLTHRFLRLLSSAGCSSLHPVCLKVLVHMLQTAKVRSTHIFRRFLSQLVRCSAEMVAVEENAEGPGPRIEIDVFEINLELVKQGLTDPAHPQSELGQCETVKQVVLEFEDPLQCEVLQTNLMKLLLHFVKELPHYDIVSTQLLFRTAVVNIELGDFELKMLSQQVVTHLLKVSGISSDVGVQSHLVSVISAMVHLLLSDTGELQQEEAAQLEGTTSALIDSLLDADQQHQDKNQKLGESHIQQLFTSVTAHCSSLGLGRLATLAMKEAVVRVLCCGLDQLPAITLNSLGRGFLEQLMSMCLGLLGGPCADLLFAAPLLWRLISLEGGGSREGRPLVPVLPNTSVTSHVAPTQDPQTQHTQCKLSRKRREAAPSQVDSKRRKMTPLFHRLVVKMAELIGWEKNKSHCVPVLAAGSVVCEVAARCVLTSGSAEGVSGGKQLSRDMVQSLCECFSTYLTMGVVRELEGKEQCIALRHIVTSVSTLLACYDLLAIPAVLLHEVGWMLSLPWLLNDYPNWQDLRPSQAQTVARVSEELADEMEVETVCRCLRGLALSPKECAPSWKAHVFLQALSDRRRVVKETAVKVFPLLLYKLGPNFLHLIRKCLLPLAQDPSCDLQNVIATVLGDMVCVAAHTVHLDRGGLRDKRCPVSDLCWIHCSRCGGQGVSEPSRQIDPKVFAPFLTLLSSPDAGVRTNTVKQLRQVFSHIPVRASNATTVGMVNNCMRAVEDEDFHVRMLFTQEVGYLLSEQGTSPHSEDLMCSTDQTIFDRCKAASAKASATSDPQLHETVLITMGQLARRAEGDLLLCTLIMLLENRLSFAPVVAPTAFDELQGIAAHKGITPQKLFSRFKPALCKFLVEAMVEAQKSAGRSNAEGILQTVANTLSYPDVKSFLQGHVKHLLPPLVSRASTEASSLIRLISNLLSMPNRRKLITNNIKDIFCFLVCQCKKPDLEKTLVYLQKETDFELGSLLRMDFQRVHNELLLRLSNHENQVFSGLQMVSLYDEQYEGPKNIQTKEEMAAYLEPRLLGVLAFFDATLVNSNVPVADKKLALESLMSIVLLMGSKHISSIRHKVVNTLRLGLQFKDRSMMEVSCRAWNCFVRSLELPLLGQMLFQIVATLLPLLLQMPRQVSEIISYMVVDNRAALQKHFHEIYFLPDLPELADTAAVLKHYTDDPSSQADLQTKLIYCIKGANHESLDVRTHALSRLRRLLREKKDSIYAFILGSESADPVISQLVSVLLHGCREADGQLQCLYGQCLGELGALDPGRLQLMSNDPCEQHARFQATVEDDNFVVELIGEVIKSFLAATEPRVQDCSAFALQELLQIYHIEAHSSGDAETRGNKLWRRLSEQQEILAPLLNTKYKLTVEKNSNLQVPIYGSRKGKNLLDWVSNWTNYLVSKVKDGVAFQVFQACSATKRHNLQVALYLLPHIVLQVLLDGTDGDQVEIHKEVMEVIGEAKKADTRHTSTSDLRHMSAQTVFSVLDYLTKWRTHRIRTLTAGLPPGRVPNYANNAQFRAVNVFLTRIPQDVLAEASYNCKAYTRSLMHFEQFISDTKQDLHDVGHLDFLQRLYDCLNEPDGVLGVAAVRQTQPTLTQEILVHESLGHQQDAQACYERALQVSPSELWPHQGFVCSLMEMGQLNMALLHTTGILADNPHWVGQLNQHRVEAAWKMCNWDCLDTMMKLEKPKTSSWPVCIGHILMAAKGRKEQDFLQQLQVARQKQMGPLSAASMEMGSYLRGYECILRLHMLSEIEEYFRVCHDFPAPSEDSSEPSGRCSMQALLQQWNARLQMAQSSFRTQEPILTMRRTLLSLGHSHADNTLDTTIGKWWLWSAKVARKAGYLQTSYGCLLHASSYSLPEFFIEKAKWLWGKDEKDSALLCLEKGITEHFTYLTPVQCNASIDSEEKKQVYAQALLLYGRYCEETSNLESNAIVKRYKDVIDIAPEWEMGHFQLAQYYERVCTGILCDKDKPEKQGDFASSMVRYFGNALKYGNQHIYQAMPRMLSLWLDYGATVSNAERKERSKAQTAKTLALRTHLARINKLMTQMIDVLAPYQFFTAFPQLVSRICHTQPDVSKILQELIARLLSHFPQQAMWMMMAVSKSSYAMRSQRCHEIFAAAKLKSPNLNKLLHNATKLTERLIELCEKDSRSMSTMSMSQHFKTLKRMADESMFCEILLPLQSAMTVTLPASMGNQAQHDPFPGRQICIRGFEDTVEVLQSLQRPKKITMVGSDGNLYPMLCKPKDDLRKDCRLMEFNVIVNRFLYKDAESRRRQLHLRTYTVTPLNEECGLLEWVNNTQGFRHILTRLYREKGTMMSGKELKAVMPTLSASVEDKLQIYRQKLLPRHPPVFKEWFLRTFPDPTSWYNARVAYARTSAVISVIGYVLGLGDRHGENILFDSTNGDTVHVDFNCLFNRGETFEWPERVPFRLTHNMVSALGPMGVEGIFRRACEVTLRVVRAQTDSLMSILKPFIYDPLVEWSKPSRDMRSNPTDTGEITNEQALNHVQNIEDRLRGILKSKTKPRGLPLSIEGHVNYLIQEATNEHNLCQMYIGWAAYM
ncbi:serine/threonine-protein kinase ATR-like isoform X2 [Babylonia areolata]